MPTGYVIISSGVWRIYTALTHWIQTLANRDATLHDKIFALEGELINNHGHVVEVDNTVFNIPPVAVHTPVTADILAVITADPNCNIPEIGPYVAGDANVEAVKVRKIYPVPHTLRDYFLHHKEVTYQLYFNIIYPVIPTERKDAVYASLTTLFSVLSVGNPAKCSTNTTYPAPPPRSSNLVRGYNKFIKKHFLTLHTNRSAAQQTIISIRFDKLATTQNTRFKAQRVEKEEEAANSVTKWLGVNLMNSLLTMAGCKNEKELNALSPSTPQYQTRTRNCRLFSSTLPSALSWICTILRGSLS